MPNFYAAISPIYRIILLCLCLGVGGYDSHGRARLDGYVRDALTKKPIAGASIYLRNERRGVVTNDQGYYVFKDLPLGNYVVAVSALNYRTAVKEIRLTDDIQLNFALEEAARDLEEVVITGKSAEQTLKDVSISQIKINIQNIKKNPVVFGEADILKTLLLQPGVTTVGEGAGGFNVRGGRTDQNLVLLDGIPLFNTSHLLGFFANVNPDVVQDATFFKGGIPAAYGGRLASLLNMNTKTGNDEQVRFSWGIGPMSARIVAEGPILKNKLTFLVGARGAYPNWMMQRFPGTVGQSRASFYDLNAKLQYKISPSNRLTLTAYRSYDNFKFPEDTLYDWQTNAASLQWSWAISKTVSLNASGIYSDYTYGVDGIKETYEFRLNSSIRQQEAKASILISPNDKHRTEAGASLIGYRLNPAALRPTGQTSSINPLKLEDEYAQEFASFVSHDWTINKALTLQAGLRYAGFRNIGPGRVYRYEDGQPLAQETITDTSFFAKDALIKPYGGFEPRVSLRVGLGERNSLKLSFNRMRQFLHLISNTTAISPVDFWKVSDPFVKPQVANQWAAGLFRNFEDNSIETSIETYYKDIENLVEYKNGAQLLLNPYLETDLLNAQGRAYGIEASVRKNRGKLTGQVSYTYSRTWVRVRTPFALDRINQGEWFPSNFDRPHSFVASGQLQIGRGWTWGFNFSYLSGRPVTYPDGQYSINNTLVVNFSKRNLDRIPSYHRLDFSITKDTRRSKDQKHYSTWNFSLYNFYARRNPYSIYFTRYNLSTRSYRLSVLGTIIPSLTLNFYY
jgi:hypothetical protein